MIRTSGRSVDFFGRLESTLVVKKTLRMDEMRSLTRVAMTMVMGATMTTRLHMLVSNWMTIEERRCLRHSTRGGKSTRRDPMP